MSEQESTSGADAGSSVVLVDPTGTSRHKQPFRSSDPQTETAELHHKRSSAPAVPSVEEDFHDKTNKDTIESKICEHVSAISSEKHSIAKKLSSSTKKQASSPESISLEPINTTAKKGSMTRLPQPIPDISIPGKDVDLKLSGQIEEEQDSADDKITELRTPEAPKKIAEWSEDEEAGGLPLSESRASRVSRAMRQLFCCGVRLDAPSEHDISPRQFSAI